MFVHFKMVIVLNSSFICLVFENGVITVDIPKKQHEELQQNQFLIPFKGFVWSCNEVQKAFTADYSTKVLSLFLFVWGCLGIHRF